MESPQLDGYQPGGNAWDPFRTDLPELLASADHVGMQPIYYGSNHTFLVTLDGGTEGRSLAVYKPARGEFPLYDFPTGTLYRREVATWLLSQLLGWSVIPPTVVARGRHGIGSVQLFIEASAQGEVEADDLRKLALIDILANNADRKAEHCLPGPDGTLWGIDHGLTFHVQPKLRTVVWHFAGMPLSRTEIAALDALCLSLGDRADPYTLEIAELLSRSEMAALSARLDRVLAAGAFPDPRNKHVPYRW